MKNALAFSLFLPLLSPAAAQSPTAPVEKKPPQLSKNQEVFLNLPEEQRKEFMKHFGEANRMFQEKRIFECMDHLNQAAKIFKDSPELYNLRGSCFVEIRAFDKALGEFLEAEKLSPNNSSIEFNIGEVYFVSKQYPKAHEVFEKLLEKIPESNIAMRKLIEFKLLLCKIKMNRKEEAVALAKKYDEMDDSPFYYFAKASLAYEEGMTLEAEQALARAGRIFRSPQILAPWHDTLVEFGYIKSFYAGDAQTAE